jgi:hypothetical protein
VSAFGNSFWAASAALCAFGRFLPSLGGSRHLPGACPAPTVLRRSRASRWSGSIPFLGSALPAARVLTHEWSAWDG